MDKSELCGPVYYAVPEETRLLLAQEEQALVESDHYAAFQAVAEVARQYEERELFEDALSHHLRAWQHLDEARKTAFATDPSDERTNQILDYDCQAYTETY